MTGQVNNPINVVLFSGGRGTDTITQTFLKHPAIQLTIMVNAYDDGLSTGRLRQFIPGLLGPSDVRKNLVRLIPENTPSQSALKIIMEYRLAESMARDDACTLLESFIHFSNATGLTELDQSFEQLRVKDVNWIQSYIQRFLKYESDQHEQGILFDFGDCSIGNLIFAGCYLENDQSFNTTIEVLSKCCEVTGTILNVTQGKNLVLTALKKDGSVLLSESDIVSSQSASDTVELFLFESYLNSNQISEIKDKSDFTKLYFYMKSDILNK